MENQPPHGTSHNSALLIIFIVVIGLLYFGFIKFAQLAPAPQQKTPAVRSNVIVTHKGEITTYTDTAGGFSFQYPSDITVNDDGVFKYNTLNLNYLALTNHDRKLGNDFPTDQYASLAAAITNGTKFQPVRTAQNTKYVLRNDFETIKIGNRYFVKDFPVTNKTCGCTEIQYVTIVGKYFVSFSVGKTTEKTSKTASQTATNEFADIETVLSSLKPTN
jgi:hypothetical protein